MPSKLTNGELTNRFMWGSWGGAEAASDAIGRLMQECFNVHSFKSYFSWKSIRRIEAKTDNGTICLGNDRFANETVAECERWMPNINTDTKVSSAVTSLPPSSFCTSWCFLPLQRVLAVP